MGNDFYLSIYIDQKTLRREGQKNEKINRDKLGQFKNEEREKEVSNMSRYRNSSLSQHETVYIHKRDTMRYAPYQNKVIRSQREP